MLFSHKNQTDTEKNDFFHQVNRPTDYITNVLDAEEESFLVFIQSRSIEIMGAAMVCYFDVRIRVTEEEVGLALSLNVI